MSGAARLIHFARDITLHSEGAPSDTELLQRFAADRDEAAFTELVRRNGSLVLRTCRHVLGESAADDAFQAVFLLLVRSAHRLTRPGSLAGWLHATAVRIAQRARRGEDRRRKREAARRVPPSAPDDLTWKEVREVLDAEIAALPENYRLPLVLCYLQELTHEEAAQRIGCEPGVLRGRLDRGRERLRRRLARYGLPLTVPALVVGTPQPAPAALVESTVRVVATSASTGAPPALAALIGRDVRWRAVLLAPVATVLAFVLATAGQPIEGPPASAPPPRATPPVTKAALPTTDALGDPLPPGAVARLGSIRFQHGERIENVIAGADGKLVASQVGYGKYKLWAGGTGRAVPLWDGLAKPELRPDRFALTPADGRVVAVVWDKNGSRSLDPVSGETIRALPPISDWSIAGLAPDGKTVAVLLRDFSVPGFAAVFRIWNADRGNWTDLDSTVGQLGRAGMQFSADSKRVAYCANDGSVRVWDVSTAKALLQLPPTAQKVSEAAVLSPDGKLLAREDWKTTKVQMWDVDTGKELPKLADQPESLGQYLAFSPDGKMLTGSAKSAAIRIWDVATRKKLRDLPVRDFQVFHVAFAGDGKRLFAADGSRVSVWDPATGKPLDDTGGHRHAINDATWSPDGTRVVSGGCIRTTSLGCGIPQPVGRCLILPDTNPGSCGPRTARTERCSRPGARTVRSACGNPERVRSCTRSRPRTIWCTRSRLLRTGGSW